MRRGLELPRRADTILEALEKGYTAEPEIVGFCKEKGIPKSSVYNALAQERKKGGSVARLTVETNEEGIEEEQFVPWSSALQQLFYKFDESSDKFGSYLSGSMSLGFNIEVKSAEHFEDCSRMVSVVSCHREAKPAEIQRFPSDAQSSAGVAQVGHFPLFRIGEGKLFFGQEEFQPSHPVNIVLFSQNCREVFYLVPYFLNLKLHVGPFRILKVEASEAFKPKFVGR